MYFQSYKKDAREKYVDTVCLTSYSVTKYCLYLSSGFVKMKGFNSCSFTFVHAQCSTPLTLRTVSNMIHLLKTKNILKILFCILIINA